MSFMSTEQMTLDLSARLSVKISWFLFFRTSRIFLSLKFLMLRWTLSLCILLSANNLCGKSDLATPRSYTALRIYYMRNVRDHVEFFQGFIS